MEKPSGKKTIFVTGSTSPIGRAICLAIAKSGCNIVLHYNSTAKAAAVLCREIEAFGVRTWKLKANFARTGDATGCIKRALALCGKLDGLVNNASIFTESTFETMTDRDLIDNLRINALAPRALCLEFKRCGGKGAIVNLLDSRIIGGDSKHAGYILSKQALLAMTQRMAITFGPHISVNAVSPGLITLPPGSTPLSLKKLVSNLPLQRHGMPDDVAQAVLFLLNAAFITGQVIFVDGGRHLRETLQPST